MIKDKIYPIGTKIRFIFPYEDNGKIGTIVAYHDGNKPTVYIPTAEKHIKRNQHSITDEGIQFSWYCRWKDIKILAEKNQQLLFNFWYEK